jgi:omega-6 fatty acid desaturase (delta-12 desaturase)
MSNSIQTKAPDQPAGFPAGDDWRSIVARYQRSDIWRSLSQLGTTLIPLLAGLYLMYLSLDWSYWLTLALALPTAGLLVRTFIIMHDCGHGSFFPSKRFNDLVGYITGLLTLTPYAWWRYEHAIHHATSGDLDRRGHGDITTLTVREYNSLTRWGRWRYRLYRHPLVLLGLGPLYLMIGQRIPRFKPRPTSRQNLSFWTADAGILAGFLLFGWLVGFKTVLLIYLPISYLAASAGVFLFFIQHQFENAYWEKHERWDYLKAAIAGCTYFKLPAPLRWISGNIGVHHVHHLAPRIPNYLLKRCHDENAIFHAAPVVTLWQSLRLLTLSLWDEERRRMVRFAELRSLDAAA